MLEMFDRLTYLPTYNHADLANELRAALDENLALRADVERLKAPKLLDDTSLRAKIGGIGNEIHNLGCSHQGNDEIARVTADLAGRLWCLAKQCSADPASAFTGRITGRNRADIPSDAGVPPRCLDESGFDSGISFPEPMRNDPYDPDNVARAIGQPP